MEAMRVGISKVQDGIDSLTTGIPGYEPAYGTDEVLQRVTGYITDRDNFALLRVESQSLVIAVISMFITLVLLITLSIWSSKGDNSITEANRKRPENGYTCGCCKFHQS